MISEASQIRYRQYHNKDCREDLETFKDLIICAQNDACEKMKNKIQNDFGSSLGDFSSILGK